MTRAETAPALERTPWEVGVATGSNAVGLWTLRNRHGMQAQVAEYGALLVSLTAADRSGLFADVVLGRPDLQAYREKNPYFGANAGRCANRISHGRFAIDGQTHQVTVNNGAHHLHGGAHGWDTKRWHASGQLTEQGPEVVFTLRSPDGEEGYPGTVDATVAYTLTDTDELIITMSAVTDAPTVVNIAHHSYWNLAGHSSGSVLEHELTVPASHCTPVDASMIPTGQLRAVAGTAFDFTHATRLQDRMHLLPPTASDPGGYDLNLVLDKFPQRGALWLSALLYEPRSGRTLTLWSDQPGIQIYTGNFLDGIAGKEGALHQRYAGISLETQAFPNAVNHQGQPGWPSVLLRPDECYRHTMVHAFSAR